MAMNEQMKKWAPGVRKDWTTTAGLRAVVLMTTMGHHCGYVAVPAHHPLHGAPYGEPCAALAPVGEDATTEGRCAIAIFCAAADPERMRSPDLVFSAHGGLTYSGSEADYPAAHDGLWWFGFDCAHLYDGKDPAYLAQLSEDRLRWEDGSGEFRDLPYVASQCESLASQIAAACPATTGAAP